MLDRIQLALRISHNLLDSEIQQNIAVARAEMIRSGVSVQKAQDDDDPLIGNAVKTYCLYAMASDEKMSDGYLKSWSQQLENLRKSSGYCAEGEENV